MFFWWRKPRIHYYAPAWNEELMLPFLFRHYAQWVERFVICDSDSTDGSLELLRRTPKVEIRKVTWTQPDSMITSLQDLHNTCWKESRGTADWVIVADIDEFLHHPDFLGYLRTCRRRGVTCIPALGYEMVSDRFPEPDETLLSAVRRGVPHRMMSKLRLFDPNALEETNFGPGGHVAEPAGNVVYPKRDELLLLHYKWLGFDYLRRRNAMMETTRRSRDIANNWSHHYRTSEPDLASGLKHLLQSSVDVIELGEAAWRGHKEGRWWRGRKKAA
ncbi:glycosyltransferase family 2 protein [Dongia deserti]|uniref:glycosyltransferase family 2 protein n=1 Tax=Dongia deserti TaxID=2268030 RepID=UPI000E6540BB|nr:glycosyltransferase family 2 protein [Dongia deserti]